MNRISRDLMFFFFSQLFEPRCRLSECIESIFIKTLSLNVLCYWSVSHLNIFKRTKHNTKNSFTKQKLVTQWKLQWSKNKFVALNWLIFFFKLRKWNPHFSVYFHNWRFGYGRSEMVFDCVSDSQLQLVDIINLNWTIYTKTQIESLCCSRWCI